MSVFNLLLKCGHLAASQTEGLVCGALCWLHDNSPHVRWDARQIWPLAEAINLSSVKHS